MLNKFKEHITQNFPFLFEKKILVACSGGLDSIVLARLCRAIGFEIGLAHCNFSLRGKESDADEEFVINLADTLSVPVFTETFATKKYAKEHGISTQMAARELRYSWFQEMATLFNYNFIATAHHADDNLETFIINLSRGTGLRGLHGIAETNGNIIRPLLPFLRDEIKNYATLNHLTWREDSSNKETVYLRNKIRHEITPKLKEISNDFLQNFQKTEQFLKGSQRLIDDYMALIYKLLIIENATSYSISLQQLATLPNQNEVLYELLYSFGFTAWQDIYALPMAETGKQIFSESHILRKERDFLLLSEKNNSKIEESLTIEKGTNTINKPIFLKFETVEYIGETEKNLIYVDASLLKYPLTLRTWQENAIFFPFGMNGKKKLSKFLKDEKLSLISKEKIYVLCSGEKIIWVIGLRADARFKITENTKTILKITSLPNTL